MAEEPTNIANPALPLTNVKVPVPQTDEIMLLGALTQAGLWAYGVKSVEAWILNDQGTLSLPLHGSWIDPVFYQNSEPKVTEALQDIERQVNQYIHNGTTLAPGVGIPGMLWSSAKKSSSKKKATRRLDSKRLMTDEKLSNKSSIKQEKKKSTNIVVWRNLEAIANDPDQPYNAHTRALVNAGFRLCAGVPFHTRSCDGIVVYFARGTVERDRLKSVLNEEYILSATEYVSAILGFVGPRKLAMRKRKDDAQRAFRKIRILLNFVSRHDDDHVDSMIQRNYEAKRQEKEQEDRSPKYTEDEDPQRRKYVDIADIVLGVKSLGKSWCYKMLGGNVMPPPLMARSEVAHSFLSSFLTYCAIAYIDTTLEDTYYRGFILRSAVGSLMTVVYGLTSAPASQPRNIILGQGGSALIGIACSKIPEVNRQIRVSLAVALAAAFMGAAGVTHPPGSSIVLQFMINDETKWERLGFLCITNIIIAILAACFNNLSSKRIYPTFWGYFPHFLARRTRELFSEKSPEGDKDV